MFGPGFDLNAVEWEQRRAQQDDENVDWKKMYLHLFNAVSEAAEILQKAQQECEDMFVDRE